MNEAELAVRTAVRTLFADLAPRSRIVVGVSGGPDSMVLLDACLWVSDREDFDVSAVIVDHQLQSDSAKVASQVAEHCRSLGCQDVEVICVDVVTDGEGIEAAARHARRAALVAAAEQRRASVIALGHTQHDQAETVLMRLARGSGARSLSAMADIHGLWRRPFLDLPRDLVHEAATALPTWRDPHNEDERFARVRVRNDALPALIEALGPGVVAGLSRSAVLLRFDADALDDWANGLPLANGDLEVADLVALPTAVRTRLLRRWISQFTPEPMDFEHVMSVDALVTRWHGQGAVALPGGVDVGRECGRLMATQHSCGGETRGRIAHGG